MFQDVFYIYIYIKKKKKKNCNVFHWQWTPFFLLTCQIWNVRRHIFLYKGNDTSNLWRSKHNLFINAQTTEFSPVNFHYFKLKPGIPNVPQYEENKTLFYFAFDGQEKMISARAIQNQLSNTKSSTVTISMPFYVSSLLPGYRIILASPTNVPPWTYNDGKNISRQYKPGITISNVNVSILWNECIVSK